MTWFVRKGGITKKSCKTKKSLLFVLAFAMVLSVFPFGALATAESQAVTEAEAIEIFENDTPSMVVDQAFLADAEINIDREQNVVVAEKTVQLAANYFRAQQAVIVPEEGTTVDALYRNVKAFADGSLIQTRAAGTDTRLYSGILNAVGYCYYLTKTVTTSMGSVKAVKVTGGNYTCNPQASGLQSATVSFRLSCNGVNPTTGGSVTTHEKVVNKDAFSFSISPNSNWDYVIPSTGLTPGFESSCYYSYNGTRYPVILSWSALGNV